MYDFATYLLDIVNNSIRALSSLIVININVDKKSNKLLIEIIDNGCGMDREEINKAINPFYTTKKVRKIGLGLPLFKDLARQCDGEFNIESAKGVGTKLQLILKLNHIDLPVFGNIGETISLLIQAKPEVNYEFNFIKDEYHYTFKTVDIKEELEDVPIEETMVLNFIKETINKEINLK